MALSTSLTIGLAESRSHRHLVFETLSYLEGAVTLTSQILLPLAADLAPEKMVLLLFLSFFQDYFRYLLGSSSTSLSELLYSWELYDAWHACWAAQRGTIRVSAYCSVTPQTTF